METKCNLKQKLYGQMRARKSRGIGSMTSKINNLSVIEDCLEYKRKKDFFSKFSI